MICIAGKNRIAVDALYYLINHFSREEIIVIPNSNDVGYDTWQPSLLFHAKKNEIQIKKLAEVYSINSLIFISLEFDKIIKPDKFFSNKLFNIHFSLLPKYKGMFTSVMPLLNGELKSGVTLHRIDVGIDTGNIIDQIEFEIDIQDNSRDLYEKYLINSYVLFTRNIKGIVNSTFKEKEQPLLHSSYYSRFQIDFSNIVIDFNKTAFEVHNQIRAFTFRDYQLVKFDTHEISTTKLTNTKSLNKPGKVLNETDLFYEVSTIDYNILLYKDYYCLFWKFVSLGDLVKAKAIIYYIPDINFKNKLGWNSIIIAVYNNHIEMVEWLISIGADINSTNYKGTNLLMYAKDASVNSNDLSMFKLILKLGVSPNNEDIFNQDLYFYLNLKDIKNSIIIEQITELIND